MTRTRACRGGTGCPSLIHNGGDADVLMSHCGPQGYYDSSGFGVRMARVPEGITFSWLARFHMVSLQARLALSAHMSYMISSISPHLLQCNINWQCQFRLRVTRAQTEHDMLVITLSWPIIRGEEYTIYSTVLPSER
jgi:hypothetical protein